MTPKMTGAREQSGNKPGIRVRVPATQSTTYQHCRCCSLRLENDFQLGLLLLWRLVVRAHPTTLGTAAVEKPLPREVFGVHSYRRRPLQ